MCASPKTNILSLVKVFKTNRYHHEDKNVEIYTPAVRPLLIQSDSASRKQPFSTGLLFDWNLPVLLIVSRVDFIAFVLFPEAVSVREYCCCTAVEIGWQLCAKSTHAAYENTWKCSELKLYFSLLFLSAGG